MAHIGPLAELLIGRRPNPYNKRRSFAGAKPLDDRPLNLLLPEHRFRRLAVARKFLISNN